MTAIIWQPSCFDWFSDGRKKMAASLDRFINKNHKNYFFMPKRSRLEVKKNFGLDFEIQTQKVSEK
jgi:hypothetical protein